MRIFIRAWQESRVRALGRHLLADSRVCAAIRAVVRPTRTPTLSWTATQERDARERLVRVVQGSRVVEVVTRVAELPVVAWQAALVRQWLTHIAGRRVENRIEMAGCAAVAAVITHSVLLWGMDVPVSGLGWSLRALLLTGGLAGVWSPAGLAAAVRDKQRP